MDKKDIKYIKYRMAAKHAAIRGIEWQFTYEQWVAWWERHLGPKWLEKRGPRKGQYIMGRKGDEGPYHSDNVYCVTAEGNVSDSYRNGKQNTKIPEADVLKIYHDERTYREIAEDYGIEEGRVGWIKAKKAFVWVTENEPDLEKRVANAFFSREEVREIFLSKERGTKLAKKFRVKPGVIYNIWRRRHYKPWTKDLERPRKKKKRVRLPKNKKRLMVTNGIVTVRKEY